MKKKRLTTTTTWYPLTALEFLARWVDHVPERYEVRVRYAGVRAEDFDPFVERLVVQAEANPVGDALKTALSNTKQPENVGARLARRSPTRSGCSRCSRSQRSSLSE